MNIFPLDEVDEPCPWTVDFGWVVILDINLFLVGKIVLFIFSRECCLRKDFTVLGL